MCARRGRCDGGGGGGGHSDVNSIQFNSIVYFRQKSIYMYIIILYNIKYNVYLPLNTEKKST